MATFKELRKRVLKEVGAENHFQLTSKQMEFWEKINDVEYKRGYSHDEYLKPGSLSLCDMDLLTDEELEEWVEEFRKIK